MKKRRHTEAPPVTKAPKAPSISDGGKLTAAERERETDRWVRQAKRSADEGSGDPRHNMSRVNKKGESVERVNSWVLAPLAKKLRVYCAEHKSEQGDVVSAALALYFEKQR
jgi:hypothetical protein